MTPNLTKEETGALVFNSRGGDASLMSYFATTYNTTHNGRKSMPQTNYYSRPWKLAYNNSGNNNGHNNNKPPTPETIWNQKYRSDYNSGFTRNGDSKLLKKMIGGVSSNTNDCSEVDVDNIGMTKTKKTRDSQSNFLPKVAFPATSLMLPKSVHMESSGYRLNVAVESNYYPLQENQVANTDNDNNDIDNEEVLHESILKQLKVSDPIQAENKGKGPSKWSTTYRKHFESEALEKHHIQITTITPNTEILTTDSDGGFCRNGDNFTNTVRIGSVMTDAIHKRPNSHYDYSVPQFPTNLSIREGENLHLESSAYSVNNRISKINGTPRFISTTSNSKDGEIAIDEEAEERKNRLDNMHPQILTNMKRKDPVEYKSLYNSTMKSTTNVDYQPPQWETYGKLLQNENSITGNAKHSGFTRNKEIHIKNPNHEIIEHGVTNNQQMIKQQDDHYTSMTRQTHRWPQRKPFEDLISS